MNSDFSIYFNQNSIIGDYEIENINISKESNDSIVLLPSYIENTNIVAQTNNFGKYMLTYNGNTASDVDIVLPKTFGISSCYPNPFNPSVTIEYSLEKESNVRLSVYNILGQRVRDIENSYKAPGTYTSIWNGFNNKGEQMPSGVYIIEVNNQESRSIKLITLLK